MPTTGINIGSTADPGEENPVKGCLLLCLTVFLLMMGVWKTGELIYLTFHNWLHFVH